MFEDARNQKGDWVRPEIRREISDADFGIATRCPHRRRRRLHFVLHKYPGTALLLFRIAANREITLWIDDALGLRDALRQALLVLIECTPIANSQPRLNEKTARVSRAGRLLQHFVEFARRFGKALQFEQDIRAVVPGFGITVIVGHSALEGVQCVRIFFADFDQRNAATIPAVAVVRIQRQRFVIGGDCLRVLLQHGQQIGPAQGKFRISRFELQRSINRSKRITRLLQIHQNESAVPPERRGIREDFHRLIERRERIRRPVQAEQRRRFDSPRLWQIAATGEQCVTFGQSLCIASHPQKQRGAVAPRLDVIRFDANCAIEALQGLRQFSARHEHRAQIELSIGRAGICAHSARNQLFGVLQSARAEADYAQAMQRVKIARLAFQHLAI